MSIECTPSSLLTRDDITSILNERHLKIPNMELMSYEELLRIYETFAQPLEKRGSKRIMENAFQPPSPLSVDLNQHQFAPTSYRSKITFDEDCQIHRVFQNKNSNLQHDLPPAKLLRLSFNTVPSVASKRSNSITINSAQEATPSKRKPITWP